MNLFDEFFEIIRGFETEAVRYAVVGGIAMAFHDQPRFTRDIDLLVHPDDMGRVLDTMKSLGYFESTTPWTFKNTQLTLRRFMKTEREDHLQVDILTSVENKYVEIIDRAAPQPWENGMARIACREDIVKMKEQRNSDQDKVDIGRLRDDKDRKDDS